MRTVRTKIYKFEELKKESKQIAIDQYRNNYLNNDFIYDDAYNTVKEFNSVFNTKESKNNWLDVYTDHIDDNILELKGFRLQKYIWNNFYNILFKRKFYGSIGDNKIILHPCIKVNKYDISKGARVSSSNFYYSRIQKENSCVLTGVCYDDDILKPIYDFLKKRNFSNCTINFYHLLNDCFDELRKSIENEINYRNTDEAIIEEIEANDYEFTKYGNIF